VWEHCHERTKLLREWNAALTLLSKVTYRMADAQNDGDFAKLLHEGRLAEHKIAKARVALIQHKQEHGCGSVSANDSESLLEN